MSDRLPAVVVASSQRTVQIFDGCSVKGDGAPLTKTRSVLPGRSNIVTGVWATTRRTDRAQHWELRKRIHELRVTEFGAHGRPERKTNAVSAYECVAQGVDDGSEIVYELSA